jgi:hypothetical protein
VALPVVVMRRSCEIREPEEARPTRKEWVPLKPVVNGFSILPTRGSLDFPTRLGTAVVV